MTHEPHSDSLKLNLPNPQPEKKWGLKKLYSKYWGLKNCLKNKDSLNNLKKIKGLKIGCIISRFLFYNIIHALIKLILRYRFLFIHSKNSQKSWRQSRKNHQGRQWCKSQGQCRNKSHNPKTRLKIFNLHHFVENLFKKQILIKIKYQYQ